MERFDLTDQSGCESAEGEDPSFWESERRRQLEAVEASRQGLEEALREKQDLLAERETLRERVEALEWANRRLHADRQILLKGLEEALSSIRSGRLATIGDGRAFTPQVAESSVDRWAQVVARATD